MLWNIDRKCPQKVVQKLLYSQYEQKTCYKRGRRSTFCGILKQSKDDEKDSSRIWKYLLKKNNNKKAKTPKHPTINHSELVLPRKV